MNMKKTLFVLGLLAALCVPVAALAFADIGVGRLQGGGEAAGYDTAGTTDTTFAEIVGEVIAVGLSLVGAIFLVLTFYAGILWMTAHGDDTQVDKSKKMIRQSIIGLAIVLGAYSITNFVVPRLVARTTGSGASGGGQPTDPLKPGDTLCCVKTIDDTGREESRKPVKRVAECYTDGFLGIGDGCVGDNVDGFSCQVIAMPADDCK